MTSSEPVRVYCFGEERLLYPETYYESVSGHGKRKVLAKVDGGLSLALSMTSYMIIVMLIV